MLETSSPEFNIGDLYSLMTALCWSVAVIFFRLAGTHFRAVPLKVFHNVATILFFAIAVYFFTGFRWLDLNTNEWIRVSLSAVIGITIADTTHLAAIRRLGAAGGALIDTLYLPLIAIMALVFFNEVLSLQVIAGGLLVIIGVLIGSFEPLQTRVSSKTLLAGIAFGVITQTGHASTVMLVKDILEKESVLLLSLYRFIIGTIVLVVFYSFFPNRKQMFEAFQWDRRLLVSLPGAFLGLFLATFVWFLGFKYTLAARAAIYNQMSTVFIILMAVFFLKEDITPKRIIAVVTAVAGGLLVAWG